MNNAFSKLHPVTILVFFLFSIGFSMFLMQPVCLCLSLMIGFATAISFNGRKTAVFSLKILLPLLLLTTLINPVFNHRGVTILTYLPWGNPLTLESVLYGVAAAVLLCTVVLWFSCFHTVMTSDKLGYLFGRLIPSLSLLLSMTLRFVPRFTSQLKSVRKAHKALGKDISDGTLVQRIRHAVKILSLMISIALENSIETSFSMKSRGFGLKGRTYFSVFHFTKTDLLLLVLTVIEAVCLAILWFTSTVHFSYFPSIKGCSTEPLTLLFYIIYTIFLLTPLVINCMEAVRWKRLTSAI